MNDDDALSLRWIAREWFYKFRDWHNSDLKMWLMIKK